MIKLLIITLSVIATIAAQVCLKKRDGGLWPDQLILRHPLA